MTSTRQRLKEATEYIHQLESQNKSLTLENDALRNFIRGRDKARPPKFFVESDKVLQMLDFIGDVLIRSSDEISLATGLTVLNNCRDITLSGRETEETSD